MVVGAQHVGLRGDDGALKRDEARVDVGALVAVARHKATLRQIERGAAARRRNAAFVDANRDGKGGVGLGAVLRTGGGQVEHSKELRPTLRGDAKLHTHMSYAVGIRLGIKVFDVAAVAKDHELELVGEKRPTDAAVARSQRSIALRSAQLVERHAGQIFTIHGVNAEKHC